MPVIGIDLGTTYCAASMYINDMSETISLGDKKLLPSVISLRKGGKIAVGWPAKRNQAKMPDNTVVEVKRHMGEDIKISLGEKEYLPQELSSFVLTEIKRLAELELGEDITGVVITCPAYFKDHQRAATKQAGELANLNVLRIINEPTAAAFAYGLDTGSEEEKLVMVYDLGGGTFDVTVMKLIGGNIEVLGTGGDDHLGGGDFDNAIVDNWMLPIIAEEFPDYIANLDAPGNERKKQVLRTKLKSFAEDAKKALCDIEPKTEYTFNIATIDKYQGEPVRFLDKTLTMEKFEELIHDDLKRSQKWLDVAMENPKNKHNFTEDDISEILLVGGSTRIPLVKRMLQERYPNTPIRGQESGINPDEIVSAGAGILAATLDPNSEEFIEVDDYIDVTGHTLGIPALNADRVLEIVPIIPKETPIPVKKSYQFATQGGGQRMAQIEVYQGEDKNPQHPENHLIGQFNIEFEPVQDPIPLVIGLDLDANGLLIAHATNGVTGRQVKVELNYGGSALMSKTDVEARQKKLAEDMEQGIKPVESALADEEEMDTTPSGSTPTPEVAASTPPPAPTADPAPAASPTDGMNPIIRTLYQKAIDNFGNIPVDRQMETMQVVGDMEAASKANDQAALMALYGRLQALLEGI